MRDVMVRAHELARGMDGDYAARMALALRQAWVECRLIENGGRLWEKNGMRRIYINNLADLYGIEVNRYNTGNISSARLDGEWISNSEARRILGQFSFGKVWYDLADGKLYCRDIADEARERIVSRLAQRTGVAA